MIRIDFIFFSFEILINPNLSGFAVHLYELRIAIVTIAMVLTLPSSALNGKSRFVSNHSRVI